MSYRDTYHPKVKSDLKKLDKPVVREIYTEHLDRILNKPYSAEELSGDLDGVFSYHFRKNNVDYRIAYTADAEKKIVLVAMIGKRENFYEMLKRRLS
jgi:addiction module RelE/StbE family toxin